MPYLPEVAKLVKSDRRRDWRAIKDKHAKAIAASKLNLDAKLGPRLDDYQGAVDAVAKLFARESVNDAAIKKVVKAAGPVRSIAETYRDQAKTKLADPARKELTAFLEAVLRDTEGWLTVEDLFGERAAAPSPQALQRVQAVNAFLENLAVELRNLEINVPQLKSYLKSTMAKDAKYAFYGLPTKKPLTEAQWRKQLAARIAELGGAVAKLEAANKALLPQVNVLLTAGHGRGRDVNLAAYLERVKKFVTSPEFDALQERAKALSDMVRSAEFKAMELGFNNPEVSTKVQQPAPMVRSAASATTADAQAVELAKCVKAAFG
jgi:hypothetical protein